MCKWNLIMIGLFSLGVAAAELPDWAAKALSEARQEPFPEGADIWVLKDETQIKLLTNGSLRVRRRMVRWALTSKCQDASVFLIDSNEETTKIKKLKGWHLRQGKVTKLEKDDIYSLSVANDITLKDDTTELAYFEDVMPGSVVAFESDEVIESYFLLQQFSVLGAHPTRSRVFILNDKDRASAQITPINFEGWKLDYTLGADQIELRHLPGITAEELSPAFLDAYPSILVGFLGGKGENRFSSWDSVATWYHSIFREHAWKETQLSETQNLELGALQQALDQLAERISYRQVYLNPGRGWEPIAGAEVHHLAYGDCKDMVSVIGHALAPLGLKVIPCLVAVGDNQHLGKDSVPRPSFNHVIAAIRLQTTLGLASEVMVKGSRYLLYDMTAKPVQLGFLPQGLLNREIMLCLEDGAGWTLSPAASIKRGSTKLSFKGQLDAQQGFSGQIQIEERGNKIGLLSLNQGGNSERLLLWLRHWLDMPGAAALSLEHSEQKADGTLVLSLRSQWPYFLVPNQGFLKLHPGLFNKLKPFTQPGKQRLTAMERETDSLSELEIDLETAMPLQPGKASYTYEDAYGRMSWTCTGGSTIKAHLLLDQRMVFFGKNELEAAAKWWNGWRNGYNGFVLTAPLFN